MKAGQKAWYFSLTSKDHHFNKFEKRKVPFMVLENSGLESGPFKTFKEAKKEVLRIFESELKKIQEDIAKIKAAKEE